MMDLSNMTPDGWMRALKILFPRLPGSVSIWDACDRDDGHLTVRLSRRPTLDERLGGQRRMVFEVIKLPTETLRDLASDWTPEAFCEYLHREVQAAAERLAESAKPPKPVVEEQEEVVRKVLVCANCRAPSQPGTERCDFCGSFFADAAGRPKLDSGAAMRAYEDAG